MSSGTKGLSRGLTVMLVLSLILAVFTIGTSLLGGSSDDNSEVVDFFESDRASANEPIHFDEWEPPADARDPFLPLELGVAEEELELVDGADEDEAPDAAVETESSE